MGGGGLTSPAAAAAAVLHAKASLHWDLLTDQKIMAIPLLRQMHARGPTNVQTMSSTKELKTHTSKRHTSMPDPSYLQVIDVKRLHLKS